MKQNEILDLCRKGQKLCKTMFVNRRGNPVTSYCLEPSGRHVGEQQALNLLGRGLFVPAGDGLFEAGTSQTWQLK